MNHFGARFNSDIFTRDVLPCSSSTRTVTSPSLPVLLRSPNGDRSHSKRRFESAGGTTNWNASPFLPESAMKRTLNSPHSNSSRDKTGATMSTLGRHFLCELSGCNPLALNDLDTVKRALNDAAAAAGVTILGSFFHRFEPHGISGLLCLAESHLAIHTWPANQYAAIDIYTCGEAVAPEKAVEMLATAFEAQARVVSKIERGISCGENLFRHRVVPLDTA